MSAFAWAAMVAITVGALQMLTGTAIGECIMTVLVGLVLAVLHVGWVLALPQLAKERAARRLAR